MITIRAATVEDAPRVVAMAMRFLQETSYGALFPDVEPMRLAPLYQLLLDRGVILVAEQPQTVIYEFSDDACIVQPPTLAGFIALVAMQHPLTGLPYGDEIAWWVEPEFRHTRVGYKLLGAAERWATTNRLSCLKMVAPAGSKLGTFYERRGYTVVETAYQKQLDQS